MAALAPGRVLVATDRASEADDLRQVLAREFATVEITTRPDAAVADFERVLPDVVLLAFESLEKSQQYCLGLLRFSKVAQSHPHRTVILCHNEDLNKIFELCRKDTFDDYVPYWPQPHDGHRLVMAVWSALRRVVDAREQAPTRSDVAAHAHSAKALADVVDRRIVQGIGHIAAAQASLADAERVAAATPGGDSVRKALASSRDSLAPASEWARGFQAETAPHAAEMRAFAGTFKPSRPVLLIVEDDTFAAKLIGKALETQGYDLDFAEDAPAVIAYLRTRQPSLILMDINLPGMDGLALTEWLKASPTLAHIPVLMLTGEATRETIARSKTAGAVGFVVKPFSRDALIAKLAPLLG